MDRVTAGALCARARRWMADLLAMAARARARRVGVRQMAIGASRVRRRGEHGLGSMAVHARLDLRGAEPMRHVAAGALRVTGGDRVLLDAELGPRLRRVAGRAPGIRRAIGFVHVMAVDAAIRAGVLGLLLGVTLRARFGVEARRAMRVMAVGTRLIAVCPDGMKRVLWPVVAAHAVRRRDRLVGAEAVAVLARGCVDPGVQRRRDGGVARRAEPGRRRREARGPVTRGARELADVRRVTRAGAHEEIGRRHLLGHAIATVAGTADRDRRDGDRAADHGRDPIG